MDPLADLTIGADDWTATGAVAAAGRSVKFRPVEIDPAGDRVLSERPWQVVLDSNGNATTQLPAAAAGRGVEITSDIAGWESVTVAGYPDVVTLAELVASFAVDPATLAPSTAPGAWWSALTALQEQVDAINPDTGAGGVTDEQLAEAIAGLYTKPVGGIPKADLAGAVQVSLGKADTALQSVPAGYPTDAELAAAVSGLAPLDSPALSGTPTVPTAAAGTNSPQAASTAFVKTELDALVAGAPGALDTLKEIADQLASDESAVGALTTAVGTKVPQGRTVNGKPLTADVILGAGDVGAAPTIHTHTAAQISDASVVGRQVLTAVSADAGRQALNVYALAAGGSVAGLPVNSIIVQATGS